jgi:hypothetical protein
MGQPGTFRNDCVAPPVPALIFRMSEKLSCFALPQVQLKT